MRRWTALLLVSCVAAIWGVAAAGVATGPGSPSPVIYPDQRLPLAFSHAAHARAGATCTGCHADAATSRSALDNLMPPEAACTSCHPIDRGDPERVAAGRPAARCVACHPGWQPGQPVARVYVPPPNLKFDHAAHRSVDCRGCHGDLAGVGLATRDHLPRMADCLGCHDGRRAPSACTTCHLAEVGGRVQTDFREGSLRPAGGLRGDTHGPDFRTHHAALARSAEAYCASCHAESFCTDCHVGVVKPLDFHPANYVELHAVDARRGSPDCSTCHRQQSFCVGCHERAGVGARAGDFDRTDPMRRFHPPGWGEPGPASHAREARRNITTCVSCHREELCLECHTAEPGGPRVDPHPAGWAGSARCEALARRAGRMCLRCHIDGARCQR